MERPTKGNLHSSLPHRITHLATVFLIAITYFYWCCQNTSSADEVKAIVSVDNRAGNPSAADYTDIATALKFSTENTTIQIQEGVYVVDNPIVLNKAGLKIRGAGTDKTTIRPQNAGKAIFKFVANNTGVAELTIDGKVKTGSGRATFAIHVDEGYAFSEVLNTIILNTGASAIIGHSVSDSRVHNNIILNAGDDGIQIRGHNLVVTSNSIIGYFDEAIDVSFRDSILVSNNYVRSGRIGITLNPNGSANATIFCNTMEDHVHGGFVIMSGSGAIISNNRVRNSGNTAFRIESAGLIASNRVEGNNLTGFEIKNVRNGVISKNKVWNARLGFDFKRSTDNLLSDNTYIGDGNRVRSDRNNYHHEILNKATGIGDEAEPDRDKSCRGTVTPELAGLEQSGLENMLRLLMRSDAESTDSVTLTNKLDGRIGADTESKAAEGLAQFLKINNPGFLTADIHGNRMTSEVTRDLYMVLKGSGGRLGIGLVRMPMKIFRGLTRTLFPVWYLTLEGEEVAIVTLKPTAPEVRIVFTENGNSKIERSISIAVARLTEGLQLIYRRPKESLMITSLSVALGSLGVLLWRLRTKNR